MKSSYRIFRVRYPSLKQTTIIRTTQGSTETWIVNHLRTKSENFGRNVNVKIDFVSPGTEIFSGKRDLLEGRPKFPNGILLVPGLLAWIAFDPNCRLTGFSK